MRQSLFSINGLLIKIKKHIVEPLNQHLKSSAFFDIADRLSPALEAMGVLLIPVTLFWATRSYEQQRQFQVNERLQQESAQNYINQLSKILLNVEDLRSLENQRIRAIATAATITLLNAPILDGERKGQVIGFLSQMELVKGTENTGENSEKDAIINLSNADLSGAYMSKADLSFADTTNVNLIGADLSGANLYGVHLSGARMNQADLSCAKNWTDEQLNQTLLCRTKRPEGNKLNPNRDCLK